jgi:glycine oxidase
MKRSDMATKIDVIIIGGGVIGCSIAYHLALKKIPNIVIERDSIGSQASGMAAGLLVPVGESAAPSPIQGLGLTSLAIHRELVPQLMEETGIDVGLQNTPLILPAFTDEEVHELKGRLSWQAELNMDIRWVDGYEARHLEPNLSPDPIGALLFSQEAQLEPFRLVTALATAAGNRGTAFHHQEAIALRKLPTGEFEVQTQGELFLANQVILAMGPWSYIAEDWLGASFSVRPQRGQLLRLATGETPLRTMVMRNGNYAVPKLENITVVGATEEDEAGFDRQVTPEGVKFIISEAVKLVPMVSTFPIMHALAGLRPLSVDGLPILGPIPGWEGIYVAAGHGRKGILFSAVTGRWISEWVSGELPNGDTTPFLPGRFQ